MCGELWTSRKALIDVVGKQCTCFCKMLGTHLNDFQVIFRSLIMQGLEKASNMLLVLSLIFSASQKTTLKGKLFDTTCRVLILKNFISAFIFEIFVIRAYFMNCSFSDQ